MGRKVHLQKDVDEIDDVQSKIFRLSRSWRVDLQGFFWLTFKLQKNCSHTSLTVYIVSFTSTT